MTEKWLYATRTNMVNSLRIQVHFTFEVKMLFKIDQKPILNGLKA